VDASAVEGDLLGHSHFAQASSLLGDLRRLLLTGEAPSRAVLRPKKRSGRIYRVVPPH